MSRSSELPLVSAEIATNVRLRDFNLVVQRQDELRIKVIANGLPLWSGAQLAVDTTLDSAGQARRHQRLTAGAALRVARKAADSSLVAAPAQPPPSAAIQRPGRLRRPLVSPPLLCERGQC